MSPPTGTDVIDLHRATVARFTAQVRLLRPDDWERPTPCTEWDVRDLVGHVVVEDLWTPPLMAGRTIAEVGDAFEGDQLGSDPARAAADAGAAAVAAVSEPGALDRTVHLSFGDAPASEYVWQITADHLIHSWDLAHAVGADERLAPDLVEAVAAWFVPYEDMMRAAGAIGPRVELPDDADEQTKLLAAFGRAT